MSQDNRRREILRIANKTRPQALLEAHRPTIAPMAATMRMSKDAAAELQGLNPAVNISNTSYDQEILSDLRRNLNRDLSLQKNVLPEQNTKEQKSTIQQYIDKTGMPLL